MYSKSSTYKLYQKLNAASDQGLFCLHTEISIKNEIEMKNYTRHS